MNESPESQEVKSLASTTHCQSKSAPSESVSCLVGDSLSKELVHSPEDEQKLLEPYNYILKTGGKQIRTKLIQAFNFWFQIPLEKCELVSSIVEMLHNSSLLLDDIEDNATLRRAHPVAHQIFGIPSTINSANYVYYLTLDKVVKEFPPELMPQAVKIYTDQLLELHRGQGLDIYWRDNYTCPTESEYYAMIRRKTGGLFGLGVRLMQLFSEDTRCYDHLVSLLGAYFQIRDDYANLKSAEYKENKSFCEDLTEGKFSFPIIHAIHKFPEDKALINILRQRTTDIEKKKFAVKKLEEFGSLAYTKAVMEDLSVKAEKEIRRLKVNPLLINVIKQLQQTI